MRKILTCIAIVVAASLAGRFAAHAEPQVAPGNHEESLELGGISRTFIVRTPPKFDGKAKLPVVIMLHGAGGSGAGADVETRWTSKADLEGFLAVFPDGTPPRPTMPARFLVNPRLWNDGSGRGGAKADDIGFISAIIDRVEGGYAADPARIYCTGFSNGASMTFNVGIHLANRIAAIAPVSGHLWIKQEKLVYPVPLLFIIGTADPLNPIGGGEVTLPWGKQYHPPVEDSIREWKRMLDCSPEMKTAVSRNGVREEIYDRCTKPGEVVYYTVEGLGHVWPGGQNRLPEKFVGKPSDKMQATDVIWDFFKEHPRVAAPTSARAAASPG